MKLSALLITPFLLLAACASPSGGSGGGGGGGGGGDSTYGFTADYAYVSNAYNIAEDSAYGAVTAVKDSGLSTFTSATVAGEAVTFSGNNNLPQVAEGSSVSFSITIEGHTFTGSAVVPDKLSSVTYDQSTRVVTWSTTPATHAAGYVTVRGSLTTASGAAIAPFADGTLTLPAGFVASNVSNKITVFATNVATDLAPAGTFESPSRFRVSRADGELDTDSFDWDAP